MCAARLVLFFNSDIKVMAACASVSIDEHATRGGVTSAGHPGSLRARSCGWPKLANRGRGVPRVPVRWRVRRRPRRAATGADDARKGDAPGPPCGRDRRFSGGHMAVVEVVADVVVAGAQGGDG